MVCDGGVTAYVKGAYDDDCNVQACGYFEQKVELYDNKEQSYYFNNDVLMKYRVNHQVQSRKPFNAPIQGRRY